MDGPISDEDFKKCQAAIGYILKRYRWATVQKNFVYVKRQILYEDLVGESNVLLVESWKEYDPSHKSAANFPTYFRNVLSRRMPDFVFKHASPISISPIKKAHSEEVARHKTNALFCGLFSEANYPGKSSVSEKSLERSEFLTHCFKKLVEYLTEEEMSIILNRNRGQLFKEIGKKLGVSAEAVRTRYSRILNRCRQILEKEKEDFC